MRRVIIGMAVIALAACGPVATNPATSPVARVTSTPSQQSTPTQQSLPSPVSTQGVSSTLLFAVLEAKGTTSASTYNTVAIAGLDGYARAKTTFNPMPVPEMGCMGAVIPPSAHVAAGKVYFADGRGVVRSLGIDNKVTTVATFPMTSSQQMLSFAVSPDGARVVGTVFTVPTTAFTCTGASSGTLTFDAYRATGPSSSELVYHQSWTTPSQNVMALTGWDAIGPVGTYPTVWASQGGGPGSTLGVYVRIDAATLKPGASFSDPAECQVWSSIASGAFACLKNAAAQGSSFVSTGSVRRPDGTEAWTFSMVAVNSAFGAQLAPDARRVSVCCLDVPAGFGYAVLTNGAPAQPVANGFEVRGWLDQGTLIGEYHPDPLSHPPFDLSYVGLSSPAVAVSMGFKGLFVGTVRA